MFRSDSSSIGRESAAALVIVLAFVVLVTALVVASLSRTQTDRTVANGSFNQSKVDHLAASAADIIIGDLRQEIIDGSSPPLTAGSTSIYTPSSPINMVPRRSGNPPPVGSVDPIPNLIRVSVRLDSILPAGVPSRASAVNSTTDVSRNGRSVSLARWNSHYLIPRHDTSVTIDSTPLSPVPPPKGPGDATGFNPPDWVILTRSGPAAFEAWNEDLADRSRDNYAIGRYAYAMYDEGGLLNVNVAGYPVPPSTSSRYVTDIGRKGALAFADLTVLPAASSTNLPPAQVNSMVGWRNFATTQQPNSSFPNNFSFTAATADLYNQYVIGNTNGFMKTSATVWTNPNPRTDQAFISRQQLLDFRRSTDLSQNTLQYLGTFSRAINAPSFSPLKPTGSSIDYATLASTSDAVNPNFLRRRVTGAFIRFDGTSAVVGEPLVKTRFPLSRLAWITYKGPSALRNFPPLSPALATTDPDYDMWSLLYNYNVLPSTLQAGTAANIKACFGLTFPVGGAAGSPWTYMNPNGVAAATRILRLDEVVTAGREPDFFELLQAGILSGSLGQDTGGGVTGGNVFPDIHMSNTTHHLLSIGAATIDQADPDSIPTRIQFNPAGTAWTAVGVESLPYITQLYPIAGTSPNDAAKWATYLLFQLWNPHQNAAASTPSVRLRLDGGIGIFTGGNSEAWNTSSTAFVNATGQSITVNPTSFVNPTPLTTTNVTAPVTAPGTQGAFSQLVAPVVP